MPTQAGGHGGATRIAVPLFITPEKRRLRNEAIEALDAHAGLILQSAARVLGAMSEAEDVAQDVAEKLLRSPPRDVRSWPALLKSMAVNRAIDLLRRRRDTVPEQDLATDEDPASDLARTERAEALRRALNRLSTRDATLFSLFYLGDLSQADIGRQLDMTPTAVGVALHRVRQRLAGFLDPSLRTDEQGGA